MHDPMTVAFQIGRILTIWHKDPEKYGCDDSCDWFNRGKDEDRECGKRLAMREAMWDMETLLDNKPHYPDSPEHKAFQVLKDAVHNLMAPPPRYWFQHPRWHFLHWRFQIHPWQMLRRRFWDKCCICGKRGFTEAAMGNWSGDKIWHMSCDDSHKIPPIN